MEGFLEGVNFLILVLKGRFLLADNGGKFSVHVCIEVGFKFMNGIFHVGFNCGYGGGLALDLLVDFFFLVFVNDQMASELFYI